MIWSFILLIRLIPDSTAFQFHVSDRISLCLNRRRNVEICQSSKVVASEETLSYQLNSLTFIGNNPEGRMNTSNFPFAWPILQFSHVFFGQKNWKLVSPWQVLVMLPVVMRRSGATKAWAPMWPWNHRMGFPPPRSSPGRLDQQLQSAQVKLKPLKTARQDLDFLLEMLCFYMFLFIFSAILDMDWWLYIIYIDFMITALCFGCILVAARTGTMKDGIRRSDADSWRFLDLHWQW